MGRAKVGRGVAVAAMGLCLLPLFMPKLASADEGMWLYNQPPRQLLHDKYARQAIDNLELTIEPGEIFAFLGPNGGGKTTLFRLLSTLIPLQQGRVEILGFDLGRASGRQSAQRIGVVFQAPSLDKKLTVAENIRHQGHLYGLSGRELESRQDEMLGRLGLADRRSERIETLSGGLRRRVELAKGMLHRPRLLLLDEPSTGLDPGARSDLWNYLREVRDADGVTVVLTTHLLEEADRADRIAILTPASSWPWARPTSCGQPSAATRSRSPRRSAGAGRGRFASASAARPACSTAACGWSSPAATSGSPGWSRPSPARSSRSRSASRRSKTCSSTAPATVSGRQSDRAK